MNPDNIETDGQLKGVYIYTAIRNLVLIPIMLICFLVGFAGVIAVEPIAMVLLPVGLGIFVYIIGDMLKLDQATKKIRG